MPEVTSATVTRWVAWAGSRGFTWGVGLSTLDGGNRASTAETGSLGRSLSGRCSASVTAALGQLRGLCPGSAAAPGLGLTRPPSQSGVLPAMLRGSAISGPGYSAHRVRWGSGSSLCPSTSAGCLVREDRGWNSSKSWGREKEVSTKLHPQRIPHEPKEQQTQGKAPGLLKPSTHPVTLG